MLVVRLLDARKLDVRLGPVLGPHRHATGGDRDERAAEVALPVQGNVAAQPDLLADVADEVLRFAQRPIDAGRGNLESIRPGDQLLDVEHHGELAAEARQTVEVDSPLAIYEQAEHLPPPFVAQLHVDELEALLGEYRFRECNHLVAILHLPEIKKWAWGPLFLRPTPPVSIQQGPLTRKAPDRPPACG